MVRTDRTWKDSHCSLDLEKKKRARAQMCVRTQHVTTRDQRHEWFNGSTFNVQQLEAHWHWHNGRYPPSDKSSDPSRGEEIRRQRIESEQRRRDELRDGYRRCCRLKDALPISNQKSSKVSL